MLMLDLSFARPYVGFWLLEGRPVLVADNPNAVPEIQVYDYTYLVAHPT